MLGPAGCDSGSVHRSTSSSRAPGCTPARILRISSMLCDTEKTWAVFATINASWPAGSASLKTSPSTTPILEPSGKFASFCRATEHGPGNSNSVPFKLAWRFKTATRNEPVSRIVLALTRCHHTLVLTAHNTVKIISRSLY